MGQKYTAASIYEDRQGLRVEAYVTPNAFDYSTPEGTFRGGKGDYVIARVGYDIGMAKDAFETMYRLEGTWPAEDLGETAPEVIPDALDVLHVSTEPADVGQLIEELTDRLQDVTGVTPEILGDPEPTATEPIIIEPTTTEPAPVDGDTLGAEED